MLAQFFTAEAAEKTRISANGSTKLTEVSAYSAEENASAKKDTPNKKDGFKQLFG